MCASFTTIVQPLSRARVTSHVSIDSLPRPRYDFVEMGAHLQTVELHQLAIMAYLHYREGWTQDEIARHLGVSRFKIMRGLREAKERRIIRFEIDPGLLSLSSLELGLVTAFGVSAAVVVAAPSPAEAINYVAAVGAEYLENSIRAGAVVGVSWGPTVRRTVACLRKQQGKPITVVELVGGVNSVHSSHAGALGLAAAFDSESRCYLLECPVIVRNRELRDSLLAEQPSRATYEVIRAADTAIFSTSTSVLAWSCWRRAISPAMTWPSCGGAALWETYSPGSSIPRGWSVTPR